MTMLIGIIALTFPFLLFSWFATLLHVRSEGAVMCIPPWGVSCVRWKPCGWVGNNKGNICMTTSLQWSAVIYLYYLTWFEMFPCPFECYALSITHNWLAVGGADVTSAKGVAIYHEIHYNCMLNWHDWSNYGKPVFTLFTWIRLLH